MTELIWEGKYATDAAGKRVKVAPPRPDGSLDCGSEAVNECRLRDLNNTAATDRASEIR